jgi:hypothetical protein
MIFTLDFLLNVVVNITMITIFICVFFFTYAKHVEKRIIVTQTADLADTMTTTLTMFPKIRQQLRPFVNSWNIKETKDKNVEANNRIIVNNTIMIIGFWSLWTLMIVGIVAYIYKVNMKKIILVNIVILAVVGLTEFFFLECIASNYISFDPNYVKYTLLDTLDRFGQKNKKTIGDE